MENEIWIDCPAIPGAKVSNWGRVLFPMVTARMPHGKLREYQTKPVIGTVKWSRKGASHVYRGIVYRGKNYKLHRLVCEAFHGPKPSSEAVVIHLDEDGMNNRPENLRWGTQKENLNMPKIKAYHRSRIGDLNPKNIARDRQAMAEDNAKA